MKILYPGTQNYDYRACCRFCHCVFLFTEWEVASGLESSGRFVRCPSCGRISDSKDWMKASTTT